MILALKKNVLPRIAIAAIIAAVALRPPATQPHRPPKLIVLGRVLGAGLQEERRAQ